MEGSVKCWILRVASYFLTIKLQKCVYPLPAGEGGRGRERLLYLLFLIVLAVNPGIDNQRDDQNT